MEREPTSWLCPSVTTPVAFVLNDPMIPVQLVLQGLLGDHQLPAVIGRLLQALLSLFNLPPQGFNSFIIQLNLIFVTLVSIFNSLFQGHCLWAKTVVRKPITSSHLRPLTGKMRTQCVVLFILFAYFFSRQYWNHFGIIKPKRNVQTELPLFTVASAPKGSCYFHFTHEEIEAHK